MNEPVPSRPPTAVDLLRAARLSALWLLVLLALLFRDLHEIATREYLELVMSRTVSDVLLLVAGVVLTLPILMVPLNLFLPRAWARPANLAVAVVMAVGFATNPPGDLDDGWFFAVELLGLAAIAWLAWRWPTPGARAGGT